MSEQDKVQTEQQQAAEAAAEQQVVRTDAGAGTYCKAGCRITAGKSPVGRAA